MECTRIGIDVAKTVFEMAVSEEPGKVSERRRVTYRKLVEDIARRAPARVVMEACGSAHALGRRFLSLGHEVVLLPPDRVRPYVQGDKTDRADAKGLLEAERNEDLHPVPVKTVEQQGMVSLHRIRRSWMKTRTARLNALRGILREFGLTIPQGARHVVPRVYEEIAREDSVLPELLHAGLVELCAEIRALEARLKTLDQQLALCATQLPDVERLRTIPGVGLIIATALVASVGDIRRFPSGRRFASYLGLVPREHSSGQTRRLGRISKRGDRYLRTLLIHGARSRLWAARRRPGTDPLGDWACALAEAKGHNRAVVALANRLARQVWTVWSQQRTYLRHWPPTAA